MMSHEHDSHDARGLTGRAVGGNGLERFSTVSTLWEVSKIRHLSRAAAFTRI